jgi:RNA polymerase sigma-70 factor (ECF subfamily)
MSTSDSFADVMARLRAGDQDAAREVFERFVDKLIRLAKRRFDAVMRRKVDPEDVVQSAYKSFFHRHAAGKLEVHDWGKLWSLLATITLRKCLDRVEYHRARCRDARREATARPEGEGTEPWWEATAQEPTPEQAAMLIETVEQLLRDLSEHERPIMELSLQGYTAQEISLQLGRAERSVRRLRERVRRRLEHMQKEV